MLQAHNLLDVLDFFVLHDLVMSSLANVEQFAAKGEDAKIVTTNNTKTSNSESLGRVSFGEDESAIFRMFRSSVVGVRQFGQTKEPMGSNQLRSKSNAQRVTDLLRFVPSVFLICWSALNLAQFSTLSMIPDF